MNSKKLSVFPTGNTNDIFADYFTGQSYLNILSNKQIIIGNVTFEPKCRNNWHIHHADKEGGQILIVTAGEGWYQEWAKKPQKLKPGDIINIPAGVKHWHGAASNSWFQHLAIEVPGENCKTEWCEFVSDKEYNELDKE